jgi:hypothetical protein
MENRSPTCDTKVTTDIHQPTRMAKETCLGFREHDRGNRKKAITHFAFVDRLQFAHLDETEAQQAATAYVNALFAKDDVEIKHLRNGRLDKNGLRNADWSPVKTQFRIRASVVGMDPSYAEYSTKGWRRHKVGDDYWEPLLKAQQHELRAALQDCTYPRKPKDGQSGFGPESMRYVLAVELHDMHTDAYWEQAKDVMIPYFERILRGQSNE